MGSGVEGTEGLRGQLCRARFKDPAGQTQESLKKWHHLAHEQTNRASERIALVVEDDEDIRALIEFTLTTQGFDVTYRRLRAGRLSMPSATLRPDLLTLDIGLPGIDGIEACRRIRQISDAYVVMITSRDDEIDRLLGLETGADDFIAKPFSARELKARVNAMFRRPRTCRHWASMGCQCLPRARQTSRLK